MVQFVYTEMTNVQFGH